MERFNITYKCKSEKVSLTTAKGKEELPHWDEKNRILTIEETAEVTFSVKTILPTDIEGIKLAERFKFDFFDIATKSKYDLVRVNKEIEKKLNNFTKYVSYGNPFTLQGKPGYKGKMFWVEYFEEKSHFEETKGNPSKTNPLGMFVVFKRPDPVIESVQWLDPKSKMVVKKKKLGQYVILRIKSKYLEKETIKISLLEYDNSLDAIVTQVSGKPKMVYPHAGYKGKSGYVHKQVSREDIDAVTGERKKGTVQSMDLGFAISHDVMKEKLNSDGSLDILIHLNPAWIRDRKGKDNMKDHVGDGMFGDLKLCVKIEHPRLPNYVEKGTQDKETGERASSGSVLGLFYGKFLEVDDDAVVIEKVPMKASKMVAAIVQNDSQMEAKGTEPCKFTYVSVTEEEKNPLVAIPANPLILFEEDAMVPATLNDVQFLVGTKEKGAKIVTIDLDNPKEKNPKKKTIVCPDVRAMIPNVKHKGNTFNISKINPKFVKKQADNQLVLEVYTEKPDIATVLKNAWLPNITPISLKTLVQTCRYQRWIDLQAYPNLSYELSFKSSSEADSLYDFKGKKFIKRDYKGELGLLRGKERKKRKRENREALRLYKKGQKEKKLNDVFDYSGFQITLEYGLSGIKQNEIAIDGKHPVFKALDTIMFITSTIRKLCFEEEVKEAEKEHRERDKRNKTAKVKGRRKKREKYLKQFEKTGKRIRYQIKNKSQKLARDIDRVAPFSIAVKPPIFAGSIAWQLANSKQKGLENQLGTEFSINFKADPLFEIEGRLDLLFIATKIPYIGQAVMGMQKTADAVGMADDVWNWFVDLFTKDERHKINIDVDYHLDLVTSAAFKPTWTAGKYHTIDGFEWNELTATVDFLFGIEAMVGLNVKKGDFSGEAYAGGSAQAKVVLKKESDKWVFAYEGLYVVFSANVNLKSNKTEGLGAHPEKKEEPKTGDRFLIQGPFTYEMKF
ncbi:hypothetical protein [Tenacibaculum maritimum]|uniref:hypothetical protein n=1 Tax=Tenacibaculum maritimum TaxID=107401 RepID=UPI00387768E6